MPVLYCTGISQRQRPEPRLRRCLPQEVFALSPRHRLALAPILPILLLLATFVAAGEDLPLMVVFYAEDCPSCEEMDVFLDGMLFGQPTDRLARYEIAEAGSMRLLQSLSRAYGIDIPTTVPVLFVTDQVFVGYEGRTQEIAMTKPIGDCLADPVQYGCESPIAKLPATQIRKDLPRLLLLLGVFLALAWWQVR